MGIELDVLTGHPEHELLFVATQVARAAGLKNPSAAVTHRKGRAKEMGGALQLQDLRSLTCNFDILKPSDATNNRWGLSWLFNESALYLMLMTGTTGKAKEFQTWVTEEVLPTIRKTGKYDAEQSSNPIALGVMDELKLLRGEVGELKALIQAMGITAQGSL